MANPKAKVLALDKVALDKIYEEQLDHHFGINQTTCNIMKQPRKSCLNIDSFTILFFLKRNINKLDNIRIQDNI